MAYIAATYTFSNGSTADASQVNQNFSDLISGLSDGTKDLNMGAAVFAGNLTANGNTALGNASSDTLTITAALSSTITLGATNTYDLGTTSLLMRAVYSTVFVSGLGAVGSPAYTFTGDLDTGMWSSAANTLNWSTGGTERMRIASGNLLINCTSQIAYPLQVGSGFAATDTSERNVGFLGSTDTASVGTVPSGFFVGFTGHATTTLRSVHLASITYGSGTYGALKFNGGALNLDTTGAIGVGLAPTARNNCLLQLLNGVGFPATQVASTDVNVLDDYEEGTWTPVLSGATTTTYTTQQGIYTKIGNVVHVQGRLTINAVGNGSTYLVAGLPFTINATYSASGSVGYFASAASSVVYTSCHLAAGGTTIYFYSLAAAGTVMAANAIFGNGTDIFFSATYTV